MPFPQSIPCPLPRVRDQVVIDGRFRLSQRLGIEACGEIWLVEDLDAKSKRVLHFLDAYHLWDVAERERVQISWTRCQELSHEHIVRIDGFMADWQDAAVLTEWVDGWQLRALLAAEGKPFYEVEEIRFWMESCCRGLHHAHRHAQIVHGNIRPSNLWITSGGSLKIGGFGKISCPLPSRTESRSTMAGRTMEADPEHLPYRSPQQRSGRPPRVADDVYSLGATLFELLAGRPPAAGDRASERSINVVRRQAHPDSSPVPADWEDLIEGCLSKNEDRRPSGLREVAAALGFELSQGMRRAPEFSPDFQELMRSSRRRRSDGADTATVVVGPKPKSRRRRPEDQRCARISRDYGEWRRRMMGRGLFFWSGVLLIGTLVWFARDGSEVPKPLAGSEPVPSPRVSVSRPDPLPKPSPAPASAVEIPSWLKEAQGLASKGQWEEADALLQDHAATTAKNVDYFLLRSQVDQRLGRGDSAMAAVRSLLTAEPRHAFAAKLKALLHRERGEHAQTVRAATWALQMEGNDNDADLLCWRGEAFRHLGELAEAAHDFTAALRWRMDADTLFLRGLTYRESGLVDESLRSFSEAIELAPEHRKAREARALLALAARRVEPKTIDDLTFLIKEEANDARRDEHYMNRMLASSALGNVEDVMADATTLLENRPDWVSVYLYRAEARRDAEDWEGAAKDLERYLAAGGAASVNLYADLAECHFKLSRFAEAGETYTKLLSIDPGFGVAYNARAYAWYQLAEETADRSQKIRFRKLAMSDCLRVLQDFPAAINRDTFVVKGWLHFKMGEYDKAEETGTSGSSYFPDSKKHFDELLQEVKGARHARAVRAARRESEERPSLFDRIFGRSKRKSSNNG